VKREKQACSRRFGEARRAGADTDVLKREMQRITAEIEGLEARLADLDSVEPSRDLPSASTQEQSPIPPRFVHITPDVQAPPGLVVTASQGADRTAWDDYVATHPAASPYHHAAWRDVVEQAMRHRDVSLIARDGTGRVVGVLPLVHMHSRLFGNFAVSMPYFNYGGPLADSLAVEASLLAAAEALGTGRNLKHIEIRETRPRAGWPSRDSKVSMVLRLPERGAELDAALGSKLRAQVQRARREGPSVHFGGVELLDEFYAVFAENMRDLGTPVYAKGFFEAVMLAWFKQATLAVVRFGGRPVAAALLIGYRDMLEIPWASTLRRVNRLGVNMLMYREILEFAISRGYGFFDFGRSTLDASTYRFKKQWGAVPVAHHWHYWLAAAQSLPQVNPDNPKYSLMISVWRLMPVWLTKFVGPHVVQGIP
jgi:FemAB-related protein (PEP-CTERM system-associated)